MYAFLIHYSIFHLIQLLLARGRGRREPAVAHGLDGGAVANEVVRNPPQPLELLVSLRLFARRKALDRVARLALLPAELLLLLEELVEAGRVLLLPEPFLAAGKRALDRGVPQRALVAEWRWGPGRDNHSGRGVSPERRLRTGNWRTIT